MIGEIEMNENDKQAEPVVWESALEFAAQTIELYDDTTMKNDYMLDASECAAIIRALKPMHPAQPVQPAGAQEPVHFRAVLCREQQDQAIGVVPKVVGFVDKKAAEQFILEKRDFQGWRYNLEPLYTEAPAVAVDEQFAVLIKKANDQAEHFEREWYLRGDELEALEQVNAQLLEALKELMYARTDKAEGMADAAIARAALLQAREAGL